MQNKNGNINHSRMFLSGISTLLKGKAAETPDYDLRVWSVKEAQGWNKKEVRGWNKKDTEG